MKEIKILFRFLVVVFLLVSCSDANIVNEEKTTDSANQELNNSTFNSTNNSVSSIERILDFSIFSIANIQNINGIYTYTLNTSTQQQNILLEVSENELKIEDNVNNRKLVFNKTNETITYYENQVSTNMTNKYIDDLLYVYYQHSVNNNNVNANSVNSFSYSTIHTAVSIQWRKSIAVENCQRLIDDYIAGHPGCSQLGGIDVWCSFGDFGCIAIGEIQC